MQAIGVEAVTLEQLLSASDIITLHAPLVNATGLMCRQAFRQMKRSALLMNTSRGGLVVTEDLYAAIKDGWIAGAALDVLETEPLPRNHPLRTLPRVLLTPHVGWYSEEAEPELRPASARLAVQALRGKRPPSLLNPAVLAASCSGQSKSRQPQSFESHGDQPSGGGRHTAGQQPESPATGDAVGIERIGPPDI